MNTGFAVLFVACFSYTAMAVIRRVNELLDERDERRRQHAHPRGRFER